MSVFAEFPKIARLSRRCIITEKIDGTNGQIHIVDKAAPVDVPSIPCVAETAEFALYAGSRSRYITPDDDNASFAAWVRDNAQELAQLGPGRHYGEWWGRGIQRNYGLNERCFSLFNVGRWGEVRPACCGVVPVLFDGVFSDHAVAGAMAGLVASGSRAAPGFMRPEGVVIFHTAQGFLFKKTLEKDDEPKGRRQAT